MNYFGRKRDKQHSLMCYWQRATKYYFEWSSFYVLCGVVMSLMNRNLVFFLYSESRITITLFTLFKEIGGNVLFVLVLMCFGRCCNLATFSRRVYSSNLLSDLWCCYNFFIVFESVWWWYFSSLMMLFSLFIYLLYNIYGVCLCVC